MTEGQKEVTAEDKFCACLLLQLVCFHYLCLKLWLGKLYAPLVKGAGNDNYCINTCIWKSQLDTRT